MAKVSKGPLAPLSAAQLAQLRSDANDLWSAAKRKGTTLDRWEHSDESAAARDYFPLGTWRPMFHRKRFVGEARELDLPPASLASRQCLHLIHTGFRRLDSIGRAGNRTLLEPQRCYVALCQYLRDGSAAAL